MKHAAKPYVVGDHLPESAWTKAAPSTRSTTMTPLYALRQRSTFGKRIATYHEHWEVLAVRAGSGDLRGPSVVPLREHTVCLIPPGVVHSEESDGALDVIWVGIEGAGLDRLDHRNVLTAVSRDLSDLVERMWLFAQTTPGAIGPELDALSALVVARFLRLRTDETRPTDDRVEKAILLFHDKMADRFLMADLALKMGCSPSYFTREFRRRTGQTPVAYLTGIRIRHATRLLETTDLKVREIAVLAGYADEFYFSRTFARAMGTSPSIWRLKQPERGNKPPGMGGKTRRLPPMESGAPRVSPAHRGDPSAAEPA